MTSRRMAIAAAALVGLTVACLDDSITGTRPLTLTVHATDSSPAVGQNVTVTVAATGTGLRRIAVDFGDGVTDSTIFTTVVEGSNQFTHVWSAPGAYTVRAEANTFIGDIERELAVTVN